MSTVFRPSRAAPTLFPALLTVLTLAIMVVPARGQEADEGDDEPPRVERVTFRGADALPEADLRRSIQTQETSCRSRIIAPLCALTSWDMLRDEHFLDPEEVTRDALRLQIYYFQRGYRSARVSSGVRPLEEHVEVVFEIREGPATVIEARAIRQVEDVLSDRRIRRADLPVEGDPLNLLRLSEGLTDLAEAYGRRGYLDAEVRDSVAVSPDGLRARVSIDLEPGPRSTLDTVAVEGNERVSDAAIGAALRLRQGRVLRTHDIAASQRSLYESNLFHEARVRVPAQPDSAKRVDVMVREAPPRATRLEGGFNSVEFGQVEGRFTHYDWLGGSRRLDLRAAVGNLLAPQLNGSMGFHDVLPEHAVAVDRDAFLQPTWQLSAEFRQPTFLSAANVVAVSSFAHRRTIPGIAVDEGYGAGVSVTRRLDFPTSLSLDYRFELTAVSASELYFCVNYGICEPTTIDAIEQRHSLSPISISYVDNNADDPVAPTTGYRLRAEMEHASGVTVSDFGHTRFSAAGSYYLPLDLHRRRILAGRLRAGWARALPGTGESLGIGADLDLLHPRKRFYAGGSRSVRGYRENQLGPRVLTVDPTALAAAGCTRTEVRSGSCDPTGVAIEEFVPRPTGGRSVLEANLEYRFPLWSFQGAVFVDAAAVGDGISDLFQSGGRAITPGFGARWETPVGPVRVDLGVRPLLREVLPVVTEYMDEDGLRHIVRLDTPFHYDPLADSGGILDQVLGRLVLHLSIGEAF